MVSPIYLVNFLQILNCEEDFIISYSTIIININLSWVADYRIILYSQICRSPNQRISNDIKEFRNSIVFLKNCASTGLPVSLEVIEVVTPLRT